MPTIPLGVGDWESFTQKFPRQKLRNMYVIENPLSIDGKSRVSRPTLKLHMTIGTGPIIKTWVQPNVLGGDTLVVSGEELYRVNLTTKVSTFIDNLPGLDIPEFASTSDTVAIVRDGLLYLITETTFTLIAIPDDQLVNSVAAINGYFIFSIKGTQKFYWLEPGSDIVDALNFASAERLPDPIIAIRVVSDEVWLLGLTGPEVWSPTGEADSPFQRTPNRVYLEGCFNRDCCVITSIDGQPSLLWVTDTKAVIKSQGSPVKISNESIEELLKSEDDLSAWVFRYNRHDFYLISSPTFTLVYDITANLWGKWDTYLLPYWIAQTGVQKNSNIYVGDISSNKLYELEEGFDDDGLPVVREVSGALPHTKQPVLCNEIVAYVNAGWSPEYGFVPTLEMRWSGDLGTTWTDYSGVGLGDKGKYSTSVSYRSLGLIRDPGRIFEFRFSDKARIRIDYVTINERRQ